MSVPAVRRYLRKLCEYGLLDSEGKTKGKNIIKPFETDKIRMKANWEEI